MRKKRILCHSNFSKAFTGFGKHKKNILQYLFSTGKYEIIELANGLQKSCKETLTMPWKTFGSLPNAEVLNSIGNDHQALRSAGYGSMGIDDIIKTVKPDVYIGIEDIWAFDEFYEKPWWNKINCMVWTTLDSLPILQSAINAAPKIKHYYVWASFAEKAMKSKGYDHVKTLRGSLDESKFFRLKNEDRESLKNKFNLSNNFVIGFVFRNQLRKSVPNMLEGFKIFKKQVPEAKLLLHTSWKEGWDIKSLIEEKGLSSQDILTTYVCKNCKNFSVSNFLGEDLNCPSCGGSRTVNTTNITDGVNDDQLNQIYNIMDVYCHPFTSGGQEIPVQEAKLTELITLVTNYSCGEDYCTKESGGLPLDWAEYREPGTQFIKASTNSEHIASQLLRVYQMTREEKEEMGQKARDFVIENCSIQAIGKELERIIDEMPNIDYDFDFSVSRFNPNFSADFSMPNDEFIITLHKEMVGEIIDKNHTSFKHWQNELATKINKQQMYDHFQQVCARNMAKPIEFESVLDSDDKGKRIGVVIAGSGTDVLFINALATNLKNIYPSYNIYIMTQSKYFQIIEDNPSIHRCIEYAPMLENPLLMEGSFHHEGYFDICFYPTTSTQKFVSYIHNGKDTSQLNLI
jgi:glycosyltransferase involved in cell wall biosynthesis